MYFDKGHVEYLNIYIESIIAQGFAEVFRNKAADYFSRLLHEPMTSTAPGCAFKIMMHVVIKNGRILEVQDRLLSLEGAVCKCKQKPTLTSVGDLSGHYEFRDIGDLKAYLQPSQPSQGSGLQPGTLQDSSLK